MKREKVQDVESMDFSKFLEQFETVDFIRMNMEGAEYEVLKHCFEKGTMERVEELQVELHAHKIVAVEHLHDEVKAKLDVWAKSHKLTIAWTDCSRAFQERRDANRRE